LIQYAEKGLISQDITKPQASFILDNPVIITNVLKKSYTITYSDCFTDKQKLGIQIKSQLSVLQIKNFMSKMTKLSPKSFVTNITIAQTSGGTKEEQK